MTPGKRPHFAEAQSPPGKQGTNGTSLQGCCEEWANEPPLHPQIPEAGRGIPGASSSRSLALALFHRWFHTRTQSEDTGETPNPAGHGGRGGAANYSNSKV